MSSDRSKDSLELMATEVGHTGRVAQPLYGAELGEGAMVGGYVVESRRSRGGFGSIYRAHHHLDGRVVAVKVLHQHMADSPTLVRRFEQEVEAIRRIRHPNAVELLDAGQLTDGRPYYVMEWLDGQSLEDALRDRGAFTVAEAMPIVEELLAGLEAAHRAGIVHRDLKSSNVMVTPAGVKLVDFGIAKMLDDERGLTTTGARVGTPSYMAPEQILGLPVTPATDVYAAGVLLFHLLTGRLPFHADTAIAVEEMHLREPPPRASERADVPGAIDAVIQRCLDKEPARRYATTGDLLAELRDAAAGDRPSRRFVARQEPAVGVYVGGGDPEAARREAAAAGLDVAWESGDALLLAALLPRDPAAARALRVRVAELGGRLAGAGAAVTAHVAPAMMLRVEGSPQYVGGELLEVAAWATAPAGALVLTPAFRQ